MRLPVVGDGPYRAPIEEKVWELALGDRVLFAGQQQDVAPWLRAADLFVLLSYTNEGMPQAVLQEMMSGLPVVSATVGAIAEAIADGLTGRLSLRGMRTPRAKPSSRCWLLPRRRRPWAAPAGERALARSSRR